MGERRNKKNKAARRYELKKKIDKKVEPEGLTKKEWRRVENQQHQWKSEWKGRSFQHLRRCEFTERCYYLY